MNLLADYLAELIQSQFEKRIPTPLPEEVSVESICRISMEGHMDYLLLGALIKLDNLSSEYMELMRRRVIASIAKTVAQVNELKELTKRFEEKGIVNQPMKGARLKFIYPSPEMREMSDIDILIDHDCMDMAGVELQDMGYVLKKSIKHHDIYQKPPFITVEAHRAMYDKTVDMNQYKYYSDFSKAELVENHSYTYNFNQNDFYVYMISHMAKHFYTMGCGIRNLLDIYVYLSTKGKTLDRTYINGELEKLGLLAFTEQMEKLAFVWLEKKPCTEFQQQVFDYMLEGGIYGKDENGIWNKFAEEKLKNKEVSRQKLKRWYFFPPISYMIEYYPWLEDYPLLLPVAWGVRAFRGIFEKKGVHKREMLRDIDQEKIGIYKKIYQTMELHFK